MLAVDDTVQRLRKRFILATFGKNVEFLTEAIGINANTLYQFRSGEDVRLGTLRKIEAWCDAQEGRSV